MPRLSTWLRLASVTYQSGVMGARIMWTMSVYTKRKMLCTRTSLTAKKCQKSRAAHWLWNNKLSFTYSGAKLFNMLPLQMRETKNPNMYLQKYVKRLDMEKHPFILTIFFIAAL